MDLLHRFRTCKSGAVALEFAIVSLLMVIASIGVIEFGRGFNARGKLSYSADFGVRKVLLDSSIADADLGNAVRAAFTGGHPELLQVELGQETAGGATYRLITLRYPLSPLVPTVLTDTITISTRRRVPLLTN